MDEGDAGREGGRGKGEREVSLPAGNLTVCFRGGRGEEGRKEGEV